MQKPEISFWLAVIIPLLGIAVQWGVFTSRIGQIEKDIVRVQGIQDHHLEQEEQDGRDLDIRLLNMEIQLAEIQKDISFIRERITP